MGRTKNCLQKKINWVIVFHYETKPDEIRCFRTARDVHNELNITPDKLYYIINKQKNHTKHKKKKTLELFKQMTIHKVKNSEELRKIICAVY